MLTNEQLAGFCRISNCVNYSRSLFAVFPRGPVETIGLRYFLHVGEPIIIMPSLSGTTEPSVKYSVIAHWLPGN